MTYSTHQHDSGKQVRGVSYSVPALRHREARPKGPPQARTASNTLCHLLPPTRQNRAGKTRYVLVGSISQGYLFRLRSGKLHCESLEYGS
jgi:hypothetical protein